MPKTVISGFTHNFLGNAPVWYKQIIPLFLLTGLALHIAEVGLIGLLVLNGVGLMSVIQFL